MNTKRILHTWSAGLLVIGAMLLTFVGCMDDDLAKTNDVVEGKPVTVSLKLGCKANSDIVVNTRVDNSISSIHRLRIFVYDEQGKYMQSLLYTDNSDTDDITTLTKGNSSDKGQLYTAKFATTSGKRKLIVIANAGGGYWQTPGESVETYTYTQMKELAINLNSKLAVDGVTPFQITDEAQMLMTGYLDSVIFGEGGKVTDDSGNELDPAITLDRAFAHITFKIAKGNGNFTPTSYRVYKIPTKSYLMNFQTTQLEGIDYIYSASSVIDGVSDDSYTFDFYLPENIQPFAKELEGTPPVDATVYAKRDEWDKDGDHKPENKTWTYANEGTFVVISGTYTGTANVGEEDGVSTTNQVTGSVEYTIHLGDFSTSGSYGDFSVKRNTSYTYNVSVTGVNNIIVEATTDVEKQPGAEGEIYDNTNTLYTYNLDAHYEQVYLEYNLSSIVESLRKQQLNAEQVDEAIGNQLRLVVQSDFMPNQRSSLSPYFIYATGGLKDEALKEIDYKWIEFWPQTSSTIAAYPGVSSWAREELTDMENSDFYEGYATNNAQYLMDVYDIIVEMGKVIKEIYDKGNITTGSEDNRTEGQILISKSEQDYVARFTAFVNEYFYLRNPLTGDKITNWNAMTNKIPREMIIAMSTDTSLDGQSSYSKIHSYISQLSMQTFYNDAEDLAINGFGIETYNETPVAYRFGSPSFYSGYLSNTDGRENQKKLIGFKDGETMWGKYITVTENGWTQSISTDRTKRKLNGTYGGNAYFEESAYSACLSRNRDLNGNGRIDENELRWYLPSINEYIRIGIGTNALSSEAKLYFGVKSNMQGTYPNDFIRLGALYYTSSENLDYDPYRTRIFWAVEKGAHSPDNDLGAVIRCIRVLPATTGDGTDVSMIDQVQPSSTYVYHEATSKEPIVLEFKNRLVPSLYRPERANTSLIKHNEDDPSNSFYDGIYVAANYLPNTYTFGNLIGYDNENPYDGISDYLFDGEMYNPCHRYTEKNLTRWRLPNQVELSAMHAAGLLDDCTGELGAASCTQFSNLKVRYGFVRTNGVGCYGNDPGEINKSMKVRCVRDVPEGYVFGN